MNNINLKTIRPQFMKQTVLALRGDQTIQQTVLDVRARFNVQNRAFNKADFFEICGSENIYIVEDFHSIFEKFMPILGIYLYSKKWRAIAINPRLSRRNWLKVAFHEVGHHFLHRHKPTEHFLREPQTLNYYIREAQANFFSDLMLSGGGSDA